MSLFFVDTSAPAKRYVAETGSLWVRSWILPKFGNQIVISRITSVEIVSLLARKQREGVLAAADILRVRNNFFAHMHNQYLTIGFEDRVLKVSRRLLLKYPLRTLDAIQLASALEIKQDLGAYPTFISADTRLLTVAAAEGLPVDDPNAHP